MRPLLEKDVPVGSQFQDQRVENDLSLGVVGVDRTEIMEDVAHFGGSSTVVHYRFYKGVLER